MYIYYNKNPLHKNTGDCTVRAISKAIGKDWNEVYLGICAKGFELADMPDSNAVWGAYLIDCGYKCFLIPEVCPICYTIADFCREYPEGTYIVGTGSHVVCVIDGDIYDSWDSSYQFPVYYFRKDD